MNLTDLYNQFLSIIANSKTILQLTEVLGIQNGDYVVVYSTQLQKPVKVKKENVQFPTTSFVRAETVTGFPNTGALDSLYLENSTNKLYKWDSGTSTYVWLLESEIQAINDAIALKLDRGTYTGDADGLLAEAKSYTDSVAQGLKWKDPVDVATTANITLSGEQTIDGVTTSASRILVKDQTTQSENGIYITAAGAWARATDADTGAELESATTKVLQGTSNINKIFTCNVKPITLGTTAIVFVSAGSATDHNSTTGKQGGTANEYYHLTSAEHTKVQNLPSTSESTANKAVDFSVIDDTKYPTVKSVEDRINEADDVKGYVNKSGFPATGEENILYIDRDLRQLWVWSLELNDYDLVGGVSQEYVDQKDADTLASANAYAESLLGGQVSPTRIDSWVLGYDSGLTFNPTFNFTIDGVAYSDSRQVTLAAADPTNPRVDVFVINISTQQIEVLTGTPAANPAEPDVDFSVYLKGPTVYLPAGATTPSNINITTVWNENTGTPGEWNISPVNADFDYDNLENPSVGTKAIKVVGELVVNQILGFAAGSDIPIANAKEFQFDLQNITTGGNFHITILGKRSNGRTDSFQIAAPATFDPANTSSYQTITVPIATNQLVSIYEIRFVTEVAGYKFYFDNARFLGGEGTSAPTGDYVTRSEWESKNTEQDGRLDALEAASGGITNAAQVIDLGDILTDTVEDAFNDDALAASITVTAGEHTVIKAIQNGKNREWLFVGKPQTYEGSATLAIAADFFIGKESPVEGGYTPPMDYNTVTELLNDQASQTEGETYRVKDASGWSTISHSGWAEFKKLATSTGAEGDYELRDQEDFDTAESVVLPIGFAASDEDTDLEAGTSKLTFRMPFAMTLTEVRANVKTAPTGSALIVDINETGVSILSTKLSIDISEKTSTTAATAAVISDANLADDAEITVDIDQVGSTVAGTGLKLWLIGTKV